MEHEIDATNWVVQNPKWPKMRSTSRTAGPIRMFIIKVGVKHPGQTEGLTDDVVKVRERR
jgi:hypothetical protein